MLVAQMVKNLPEMWQIQVQSLGQEDPLQKRMANHSTVLSGDLYGEMSMVYYIIWGHRIRHDWATHTFTFCIKKKNNSAYCKGNN